MRPMISAVLQAVRFMVWTYGTVTAVLLAALGIRLWLLRWWGAMPFGDVFNFVGIAQALGHLTVPLQEKRLPFYPLLILLGHGLLPDARWETIAIGLAIAMSLLSLVLLFAIGRTLSIRTAPLLVSLTLVASYPPFLSYSIRGYADTTFVALLLGSILATLRTRTWRGSVLLGILIGFLTLTRYEGVAAGIVLLVLHALRAPRSLLRSVTAPALCILVLLPYVAIATRSGRSLLPTAYLQQARHADEGYGAGSWREFLENYREIGGRIGLFAAWRMPPFLVRELRDSPITFHTTVNSLLTEPRNAASLLAIPGFLFLLARRRRDAATVVLPFFAVATPIAWWAPYIRYDAFVFPLIALSAGIGLHALLRFIQRAARPDAWGRLLVQGTTILAVLAGVLWLSNFTEDTRDSLRKSRLRGAAWYRALHEARTLPGTVVFDEWSAIVTTYFDDRAVAATELFAGVDPPREQWDTLRAHTVRAAVVREGVGRQALASLLASAPPTGTVVQEVARFHVEQGNHDIDETVVYTIAYPP